MFYSILYLLNISFFPNAASLFRDCTVLKMIILKSIDDTTIFQDRNAAKQLHVLQGLATK